MAVTLPLEIVNKVLADFQNPAGSDSGTKWGLVVDIPKFNQLGEEKRDEIIKACHSIHNVPQINGEERVEWIWTMNFHEVFESEYQPENSELPHLSVPVLCNHCENPPCVKVCPTQATFVRDNGIVQQDYHRCIGCRYCMAACPYGLRSFNWKDPRPYIEEQNEDYPTRSKGVVEKCNFCIERLERGEWPACVEASEGAFIFGDLNKFKSEINKMLESNYVLRRKVHLGTEPKVFYLI